MNCVLQGMQSEIRFDQGLGDEITVMALSVQPVFSVDFEKKSAEVSTVGVQPTVALKGRVIRSEDVSNALRQMADLIDKEFKGTSLEEFRKRSVEHQAKMEEERKKALAAEEEATLKPAPVKERDIHAEKTTTAHGENASDARMRPEGMRSGRDSDTEVKSTSH